MSPVTICYMCIVLGYLTGAMARHCSQFDYLGISSSLLRTYSMNVSIQYHSLNYFVPDGHYQVLYD